MAETPVSRPSPTDPDALERVRSSVVQVTHHIDARRWSELRALYADELDTDYTSLFGGTPARQSADTLIQGWRSALAGIATHHQLGPIDVALDGTRARASCHVRALHHAPGTRGGDQWEVLGHYIFGLREDAGRWSIESMRLETLIQTGNTGLLAAVAEQRAGR
jgi:hypothetical protein